MTIVILSKFDRALLSELDEKKLLCIAPGGRPWYIKGRTFREGNT